MRTPNASISADAKSALTLRTAKRLQSGAIDCDYFAGVGPIIGSCHKPCTDRILPHVVPFLRVALVTPQNVIEESTLPDWVCARGPHDALRETLFQKTDPASQLKVVRPADEQMNVIGHNHVAPDGDVVLRVCSPGKFNERSRDWIFREDRSSAIRAGRHEENRITRNDAIKPGRSSGEAPHFVAAALWAA